MTLHVPETSIRFSTLDFPSGEALERFMARFKDIYIRAYNTKKMPFDHQLPLRQLNDALLALAPGLVQGFEGSATKISRLQLITFTSYEDGSPVDFPAIDTLRSLIRLWLQRWAAQPKIQNLIAGEAANAWAEVMEAITNETSPNWQHGIDPHAITDHFESSGEKPAISAYIALPALLVGLLHNQTTTIKSGAKLLNLRWRRVNEGGKDGLHLVSQPIQSKDDYFAYRLDFSVQTQVGLSHISGMPKGWIFTRLSIQRYITLPLKRKDSRNVSVLVGHNLERFMGGAESDTTLIRLPVSFKGDAWDYESGVGGLLDDYAMRPLLKPDALFNAPGKYGAFNKPTESDNEYYIVYAEGRKFGEGTGRQHRVLTGIRLHERARIIHGIIEQLEGWLRLSPSLVCDAERPSKLHVLYTHSDMKKADKKGLKTRGWQRMLMKSLANGDAERAHLIVLQQHEPFMKHSQTAIDAALLKANTGDNPSTQVDYIPLPVSLYHPLDTGNLDPALLKWENQEKRPKNFRSEWKTQIEISRDTKLRAWCEYLDSLPWLIGSRRLLLIDSTGESDVDESRQIKGIIREACNLKGISSQFIIGKVLKEEKKTEEGETNLKKDAQAKIRSAALDLIVRQQGILYGEPSEVYTKATGLPVDLASQMDVIAFSRVQIIKPFKLQYVVAVRLRADGVVDVALPDNPSLWLPYPLASHAVGQLFARNRVALSREREASPLRLQHTDLLNFIHAVLVDNRLQRPTIAVIEAEGWRNSRSDDDEKNCWVQLRNSDLSRSLDELQLGSKKYRRDAPRLDSLLGVIRLRKDKETPQYLTTAPDEIDVMKAVNVPHLTGYVDTSNQAAFHYYSVAGLPELQKNQPAKATRGAFKADVIVKHYYDVAIKHSQIIEMLPFFVHPRLRDDVGMRGLCRAIHFLRISPSFTMGDIVTPYPMHLGEQMILDQLAIIGADR
jgi:hypothetical protein